MVALWSGVGQVVDVNLLESLFQCMGPLPGAYAATGYLQPRLGSGIPYSVPRGTWRCSDGRWVAVSTSAESVAERVMELIGFGDRADLQTFNGRIAARDEVDARMAEYCAARTRDEVLAAFEEAHAAAAPIYDMKDIAEDEHYHARGSIIEVDGVKMQGLVAGLSKTPGEVRWPGRALGADEAEWAGPAGAWGAEAPPEPPTREGTAPPALSSDERAEGAP
jgi:crotonobetainyl-CoA:carnitine CoA-transferase CaiB-like acyl-CoA transferase